MVTWLERGDLRLGLVPELGDDLRFTRAITILDDGYRLDLRAENVSGRPVRWVLWNVTQLPGGGTGTPVYTVDGDRRVVPPQDVVGKLGVPGTAGWVTYGALTLHFDVDPAGEYPDETLDPGASMSLTCTGIVRA